MPFACKTVIFRVFSSYLTSDLHLGEKCEVPHLNYFFFIEVLEYVQNDILFNYII